MYKGIKEEELKYIWDKYYKVEKDPIKTISNKLGICQDQAIAIKYLMNKLHPEDEVKL